MHLEETQKKKKNLAHIRKAVVKYMQDVLIQCYMLETAGCFKQLSLKESHFSHFNNKANSKTIQLPKLTDNHINRFHEQH